MYCLRCGRETEEDQAFCLECQKEMAKCPVDPNAVVQLPVRKPVPPRKPVKRRISPEEQVKFLKRRIRLYTCLLAAALLVILGLSIPAIRDYGKEQFQIGQNYSTVKPSTGPAEVPTASE